MDSISPSLRSQRSHGFTIIEIAVVLAIVGALIFVVLKGSGVIGSGNMKDLIAVSQDMSEAVREFKRRYKLFPGDFKITAGAPEILGVSAQCKAGGANAGNNNGVIEAIESPCVPEVLFRSGIIGTASVDSSGNYTVKTAFGSASIIAASLSGVAMPGDVVNVMTLSNVPCDSALAIDRAIDDGQLSSGKVRSSVASCTIGGANDPVPILAIGL